MIPKNRRWKYRATLTRPISTGTSTSGPITAAKAAPELMPNTATATAIASSKLLLAAVNDERGRLGVVGPDQPAHPEADQEHHHEVDQQRHGDPQHVQRNLHDQVALEAEHHQDREQQGDQRDRADRRNEPRLVPRLAL